MFDGTGAARERNVLFAILVLGVAAPAGPRDTVRTFLAAYLKQDVNVSHLQGAVNLSPFLSKRLVGVLRDAIACEMDWARQQPPDSTDKPPFVDCCTFASSPEGIPTSFKVGKVVSLSRARTKVLVRYTYKEAHGTYSDSSIPLKSWSWTDAVVLQKDGNRYVVDDFLYLRGSPGETPSLLSESFEGCRGPKWVGFSR